MTAFGAEEKALGDSVELVSNRSASFRQGSEGQLWVDAVEKCGFLLGAAVFRLSCAGGCYSNLRCVDFDANWTDPIVSDFTHMMRTVGLMAAQGFGAQAF
jgi:hypothetical protein